MMESPLRLVDTAVNSGMVWVNAAGNDAQRTWYSNSPNFDSDGYVVFPGPTVSLPIRVNASGPRFVLRWKDEWTSPAINLDLYLYYNVPGTGHEIGWEYNGLPDRRWCRSKGDSDGYGVLPSGRRANAG